MDAGHPHADRQAAHAALVDGNAVAGILADLLAGDATALVATCGECGAEGVVAEASVELDAQAALVRCRHCTHTLFTVIRTDASPLLRIGSLSELRTGDPSRPTGERLYQGVLSSWLFGSQNRLERWPSRAPARRPQLGAGSSCRIRFACHDAAASAPAASTARVIAAVRRLAPPSHPAIG